jgi:hypothetical protein
MTNSTLFERKHAINSRESFVSAIGKAPLLDREEHLHALFGSHGTDLTEIRLVGFIEAPKDSKTKAGRVLPSEHCPQ